ncbi:MAG: polymer-forming cytoskeletal protein [Treponema sp.]|nr:polymer-forming cytoskeletal protein [Treponema sp.]
MFDVKDSDFFEMEDDAFDTVIENDISFSGNAKFKKPLLIRGKIKGKIDTESDLVVDNSAVIEADITASRVLIRGKVKGNVTGNKLIFVTASGELDGDIVTEKVVFEPGCKFSGKCTMITPETK